MSIKEPFLTAEAIREGLKRGPALTKLLRRIDRQIEESALLGRTSCGMGIFEMGLGEIAAEDLRARGFTVSAPLYPSSPYLYLMNISW